MIEMTDEEFQTVSEALEFANSGWEEDDVPHLVALEAKALEVVHAVRDRAGLPA